MRGEQLPTVGREQLEIARLFGVDRERDLEALLAEPR